GQRVSVPGALRHPAVRERQAAARGNQAAGDGRPLLSRANRPAPADRDPRARTAARARGGPAAQPQVAQLRRSRLPVNPGSPDKEPVMNVDDLVAIDIHTHAEVSTRILPDEAETEALEARGKYFRYEVKHPTIAQMADY